MKIITFIIIFLLIIASLFYLRKKLIIRSQLLYALNLIVIVLNLIFGENEKYVNDFIGDSIVKQTAKQLQKHTTD
jgi:hypothetical protein